MISFFTRNFGWKLLALAMAIALWIAVAREPELATTLSAPIEFKSIPEDLDIGGSVPERVRLELRGPSGRLSHDNLSNVAVILDLTDANPGERTYNIRSSNVSLPAGVSFYRAVPSQITLRFDRMVTREVDIELPPFSKGPPEGYKVRAYTLEPSRIKIRGPALLMRSINHVTVDPVDLSGVVSQREFHTHINIGDPQVRLEVQSDVALRVTLEKTPTKETK